MKMTLADCLNRRDRLMGPQIPIKDPPTFKLIQSVMLGSLLGLALLAAFGTLTGQSR
jgi:hypothetical protein